ncbi:hypothetical protein Glove_120g229 [Diversispora epigaea]|uniref:Uncharacterized protein n=1 Tax=Diversispora epigaea TaxID=1348612 RepID=A0A397J8P4_9GLOM|nr:hypothetical protein Glove_120g229 [Diversispora epigaea]
MQIAWGPIQAHDHWSNNSRQDVFFTASSLYAVIESMKKKLKWIAWGPIQAHDHWSNNSRQDVFFTASSLYAVIESMKKKLKWVTIISSNGNNIETAISEIYDISVSHLKPDRKKDISNLDTWINFFPKDLEKLQLKAIEKSNPNLSILLTSKNI